MVNYVVPQVIVYPQDKTAIDISEYVQAINISNSINNPVGSCQITFNPTLNSGNILNNISNTIETDLRALLKKNSIIAVKMDKSSPAVKFLGFIDHIPERIVSNNASVGRTITINASMLLPKMLVRDDIVNAPELVILPEIKADPILSKRAEFFNWQRGLLPNGQSAFANTPDVAIKWILNNAVSTNAKAIKYNNLEYTIQSFISDENDYQGQPAKNFKFLQRDFLFAPELSTYSGTILNYLWSCVDKDFYEIFFDATATKDSFPLAKIVIRPKPYTYKKLDKGNFGWVYWEDLPPYTINSDMRLEEVIGQSDFELKNFFQCYYNIDIVASADGTIAKFGYQFPIINIPLVKKFGLRTLVGQSKLMNRLIVEKSYTEKVQQLQSVDINELASKEYKDPLLDKRDKLMYWYGFPHYESGQITLIGGDYRIGNKLFYEDRKYFDEENGKYIEGVEYYIESVRDTYRYPNFYTTTLGLTRGTPRGYVEEWFSKHEKDFIKINTLGRKTTNQILLKNEEKSIISGNKIILQEGVKDVTK